MLAMSLNTNFAPPIDQVEDVQEKLFELTKDNRKLRFEVTQLTQKNTQLTMKIASVDAMYEEVKAKLLVEVEGRKRWLLEKESLERQLNGMKTIKESSVLSPQPKVANEQKMSSQAKEYLQQIGRQLADLIKSNDIRGFDTNNMHSAHRDLRSTTDEISRAVRVIGASLDNYKHSNRELNDTLGKYSTLLKSLKQDNEDLKIAATDTEQVREELERVYEQKAELKAQINVHRLLIKLLRQRLEELDRRNDYFEKQAKQSSLVLAAPSSSDNDQQFAVELLLLQKSKLYNLIERLIQTSNSKDLAIRILEIFNIQLEELDLERHRLELEYELEDLQRSYKRACDRNESQPKLVATRKEIQRLRSELSSTLVEITSCNTILDSKFELYVAWNGQNEKVRNYCWDVEKKLAEGVNPRQPIDFDKYRTSAEIVRNRPAQQRSEVKPDPLASEQKNQRIYFYQTNEEPQVISVVNKDREHLQSLFKETRNRLQHMHQSSTLQ